MVTVNVERRTTGKHKKQQNVERNRTEKHGRNMVTENVEWKNVDMNEYGVHTLCGSNPNFRIVATRSLPSSKLVPRQVFQ